MYIIFIVFNSFSIFQKIIGSNLNFPSDEYRFRFLTVKLFPILKVFYYFLKSS